MLCGTLIALLFSLLVDGMVVDSTRSALSSLYGAVLILGLLNIYINFELFGLTLILLYSSVFLVLYLLSYYLSGPTSNKKSARKLMLLCAATSTLLLEGVSNYNQINNLTLSLSAPTVQTSTYKFISIIHVLVMKLYLVESLVLNLFLVIGLIAFLVAIPQGVARQKTKVASVLKPKRIIRRSPNFKKFI